MFATSFIPTAAPRRPSPVAAIALALAGLLASAAAQAADPAPRAGGALTIAQSSFPPCLDLAQSARAQNASRQALDALLDQDKRTGEVVPWLATRWTYQDEGKTLVLRLRDGVTFSNGERFDAASVKANFDALAVYAREGRAPQASGYLTGYLGADVLDPLTVALRFDHPKAGFLQALTEKTLAPLAPATLAKTPEERCQGALIGTGPFVIAQVVKNDRIVLKRRADYQWASPNAEHQGPAWLDQVTFQTVSEGSVRVGSLISRQVGAIEEIPTEDVQRVKAAGASVVARSAGGIGITLYPNIASPVLSHPEVRQALVIGVNRAEIIEALYTEYDKAATSVVSTTVPGYVDLSAKLAYRPDAARALLERAGWKAGKDGIRSRDGQRLQVGVTWSFPGYTPTLELIKEQLARIGVDLRLNLRSDAEIGGVIRSGNYDLRLSDLTRPDPDVILAAFSSKFGRGLGAAEPALDALLDQQSVAVDTARRKDLVAQVQNLIIDQGYAVPIKESNTVFAVAPDVRGLWLSTPRWPVLHDTWLAAAR
ncbi:Nickel-binding periplasmic protein [Achromobacter insuavis]|uniref:ABC transporter substrate-binding protein n=1 Tax=Achromobacter insuavis TaxID=1287735 RepID=UPI001468A211|nr:ABC transporter substrate-binding protein [Achromobacter insuavis]CAB3888315.1 Nickel-binding periplasmic protein [Achromobacter insuavis]